jgi:hypothetical protein
MTFGEWFETNAERLVQNDDFRRTLEIAYNAGQLDMQAVAASNDMRADMYENELNALRDAGHTAARALADACDAVDAGNSIVLTNAEARAIVAARERLRETMGGRDDDNEHEDKANKTGVVK